MENGVDHNYNDPGDPVGSLFCWWDLLTTKQTIVTKQSYGHELFTLQQPRAKEKVRRRKLKVDILADWVPSSYILISIVQTVTLGSYNENREDNENNSNPLERLLAEKQRLHY